MARKVLLINTTFEDGGAAGVAKSIFFYLNKSGLDAYFAYGRGKQHFENKTFKFGNILETLVHIFLVRFFGLEGYGNYFSTRKLIKYIKKEKFNAVHLHNLHGYYLNFYTLIKFLNNSGILIIWTLHDEWPLAWLPAHSTNDYSYPKTYNKLFSKFLFKKKQRLFRDIPNLTIICPAEWQVEKIKNSYLKHHNIQLIHNGVDIDLFKPVSHKLELRKKYDLPADKNVVLFSATNLKDKNKGTEYMLQVADSLKEYLFLGVGRGKLPTHGNIKVIGYTNDRKVLAEIFGIADLFCITSLAETQPLVVLEALASGLPIVGFDILGLKEIVNEKVGSLVSVRNVEMLSKMIASNFLGNIGEKSRNARELAVNSFSERSFLNSYKNIYNEILK